MSKHDISFQGLAAGVEGFNQKPGSISLDLGELQRKIGGILSDAAAKKGADTPSTQAPETPNNGEETPIPTSALGTPLPPPQSAAQIPSRLDQAFEKAALDGGRWPIRGGQIGNYWAQMLKQMPGLKEVVQREKTNTAHNQRFIKQFILMNFKMKYL